MDPLQPQAPNGPYSFGSMEVEGKRRGRGLWMYDGELWGWAACKRVQRYIPADRGGHGFSSLLKDSERFHIYEPYRYERSIFHGFLQEDAINLDKYPFLYWYKFN